MVEAVKRGIEGSSVFLPDLRPGHELGFPLTRPSGTLCPSDGERDKVRGRFMGRNSFVASIARRQFFNP